MTPEMRMAHLVSYRGRPYWLGTLAWIAYFIAPLAPGWLTASIFARLQAADTGSMVALLALALLATEAATAAFIVIGHRAYMQGLYAAVSLGRANALAGQLASGGREAARRQLPVGDAMARLRDDPVDMVNLLDNWTDLAGSLCYGAGAAWLLARIDPWAAVVGIAPLFAIGAANTRLGNVARRFRLRARAETSTVTSFLNAAFSASLSIKLAGAQRDVVGRLDQANVRRSKAMVADQIWEDAMWATNGTLTDVSVGLALLVAARGPLDAGEVTLFAGYLFSLVWLPQRLGGLIVGRRRYEVSAARLGALMAPPSAAFDPLLQRRPLPVLGGPAAPRPVLGPRVALDTCEVQGLTVAARHVVDVSVTVRRGELVVVSGAVGSGKSTVLRAIVGLARCDSGVLRWNGEIVADPAAFMVPPQCAYVAQVPHLFAESLRDNVTLGHDYGDDEVIAALRLAAFDEDLAGLPDGLDTMIGSRGVRLSGGQAQRVAAARALVHRPELVVFDDLSSALDVHTETVLWERLLAEGCTILTATNRATARRRAARVLEL